MVWSYSNCSSHLRRTLSSQFFFLLNTKLYFNILVVVWNLQLPRSHASDRPHSFPNPYAPCFHRIRSLCSFRHDLQLSPRCQNISTSQRNSYWILGGCKSCYCRGWCKRSFRSWIEDAYFSEWVARVDVFCTLEVFHGSVSAFVLILHSTCYYSVGMDTGEKNA